MHNTEVHDMTTIAADSCAFCGGQLPPPAPTGRPRRFCSAACRQRGYVTYARLIDPFVAGEPCGICRQPMRWEQRIEIDHVIPVSAGGRSTAGNLRWVHGRCNKSKGAKVPDLSTIEIPPIPA